MNKTNLAIIIYVIGIIIGMFILDIWSAETSPKAILGMIWTALFATRVCLHSCGKTFCSGILAQAEFSLFKFPLNFTCIRPLV